MSLREFASLQLGDEIGPAERKRLIELMEASARLMREVVDDFGLTPRPKDE